MPRLTSAATSVKLKPADPFDLIRWLARSQSDPRKAVAELVQNSIDADARSVRMERRRVRKSPSLIVRDDGRGVLPDLDREEALRTIATNIGCSRKRGLSARERHEQVVAGKYGIGLLGFWAIGHRMEIRSRVRGGEVWVLRLVEDRENAEIARERLAMESEDTFTEVVISELHESAARMLSGRRLTDYLAAELRGMLLQSGINIEIFDGIARGTSQKRFSVVPRRFTGERLTVPEEIPVPDMAPIRLELYLARGAEKPTIEVTCAGTIVADDIGELRSLGLDRSPWIGREVAGLVDFSGFNVPPGTRRGVAPDAAAEAFVRALDSVEPALEAELARLDRQRGAVTSRQVVQDLRKALKGLRNRLPQYELPPVDGGDDATARAAGESGIVPGGAGNTADDGASSTAGDAVENDEVLTDDEAARAEADQPLGLFPPGPLSSVRITPPDVGLAPGRERRVRATALDADGRRVAGEVTFTWTIVGVPATVLGGGARPALLAGPDARPGTEGRLILDAVEQTEGGTPHRARAETRIFINEEDEADKKSLGHGIPEPELVDDAPGSWRSRFHGQRWQVNAVHEDYVQLAADPKSRVRYLLALLAKEIAQRTHGVPGSEAALESLVEILAHAERNLRGA
jgi:hypothetical protein